jgi:hypothetical protein
MGNLIWYNIRSGVFACATIFGDQGGNGGGGYIRVGVRWDSEMPLLGPGSEVDKGRECWIKKGYNVACVCVCSMCMCLFLVTLCVS